MRQLFLLGALMPLLAHAQSLDSLHIMVDAEALPSTPYIYNTFQSASEHFREGTTVYIRPGVYWIDDPDDSTVRVGRNGREPFGMVIRCPRLHLIGLGDTPQDVVLASQRGQTQGAIGNFTMFDFWCQQLVVGNLTMGNYCNVDLVYPKNPRWNRPKRSDAITQAHVGYVHGDSLIAKKVRFVSRLNLNPLNGAKHSYYEDCHFECTDDALNGNATYRHCDFDFYGTKPFWSTFGRGALLIDCDFYARNDNAETYFCKQGGPVTVINCRYHAPSDNIYIGWTAYPQPWLRCYQKNFTLNGKPYVIGNHQPQNTLSPSFLSEDMQTPPFLSISTHEASLLTGRDTLYLSASLSSQPSSPIFWRLESGYNQYASLCSEENGKATIIPVNNTDETVGFCVIASTDDGQEAACYITVAPSLLPPPVFTKKPVIKMNNGMACLDYALNLEGRHDESKIIWSILSTEDCWHEDIVAYSNDTPVRQYRLSPGDIGHRLAVTILPKHQRSLYGEKTEVFSTRIQKEDVDNIGMLDTDFHDFYCGWKKQGRPGSWTVDGYKPADTAEYDWSFDTKKPMWEYKEGFNGAVGKGLLQAQRGARLMYTPVEGQYGDMRMVLNVDPTKEAGQGFGSATGQYMDVCLKFDPQTLTGYGLRIIRTTKHAKAVDFLLVRYDHGTVTPISSSVSSTCYRTGCTISLDFTGCQLTAHVETTTPQPADSRLPHVVDLSATVVPNTFGGIHIQHTGTSGGESTTMLHRLQVEWK